MTLSQLRYILAVEETGSFQRAAERCCVTQPTLSMQIHKLEAGLGVKLFNRSRYPVRVTDIGNKVLEQARIAVREADRIEVIVQHDVDALSGTFRLGVIPTLAPYLLPLWVPGFRQCYPEVRLSIEEMQTGQMLEALKKERLDAGLLATPVEDPLIEERPLFYEAFYLYLSRDHPLSRKKEVSHGDLEPKEIFLLTEGHCFRTQVMHVCQSRWQSSSESDETLRFESGSLETLKKMVDHSSGYTLLPELAARSLLNTASERHRLRSFTAPAPMREVGLVWAKHTVRRAIREGLWKKIRETVPEGLTHAPQRNKILPIY